MKLLLLDPFRVKPFADQPRKRFRGIPQLAESIRLVGQVTPIIVTSIDGAQNGFVAELVDGERRLQACRQGKMQIKAVMERSATAAERFALSVAANFCRQGHDCIEIAHSIERLQQPGRTQAEIGGIFGKSDCWVSQHLSLLKLHPEVRKLLERPGDDQRLSRKRERAGGRLTFSLGLLLAPLEHGLQVKAARHIAARHMKLPAARNYIQQMGKVAGYAVGKKRSPYQQFNALWSAVLVFRGRVEMFINLPYVRLAPILAAVKSNQRRALVAHLTSLADDLAALKNEFARTMKESL